MVLTTALLIAGCTTTQPVQQCSPKEKARLSSNVASTKAKLEQSKAQLARTRTELSKQSCFSAGKSTSCTRLKTRADKLQSDVKTLENQLSELNATIAGRSHAGRFFLAC
jgi:chromosome segregation ATPase